MTSTFGGLNIMSGGLYAQQAALNTVGHNISNANTEGYSRQTVNLATTTPGQVYGRNGVNQAGTGVTVASITRARNVFVDRQLIKETSTLSYSQTSSDALSKMEGVFNEPSDTGMQTVLNQFWTSLQTLSTNASDSSARTVVLERGQELVNAVQASAQQMKDNADNINFSVSLDVSNINQITSDISKLNQQIVNTEVNGTDHANDLRDSRDLLVDQLSKLVDVSVSEDNAGNYAIKSAGVTLVDGSSNTQLDTATTNDSTFGYTTTNVVIAGTSTAMNFTNGEMKALIDSRDSTTMGIKGYLNKLDTISQFLLQDFNNVHKAGVGTDGSTGVDFFGDNSTTDYNSATPPSPGGWISLLKVNPDLSTTTAGLAKIAANTSSSQGNASGDNAILLGNRLKTDVSSTLGGSTLDSYYQSLIGSLGVQSQDAQRQNTNQQMVVDQLTTLRQSTAGVNMDEEMTNMIRYQKGYQAAARVLTAMDEMLDKLINSTGIVGR